jgi:hypothetical protein
MLRNVRKRRLRKGPTWGCQLQRERTGCRSTSPCPCRHLIYPRHYTHRDPRTHRDTRTELHPVRKGPQKGHPYLRRARHLHPPAALRYGHGRVQRQSARRSVSAFLPPPDVQHHPRWKSKRKSLFNCRYCSKWYRFPSLPLAIKCAPHSLGRPVRLQVSQTVVAP